MQDLNYSGNPDWLKVVRKYFRVTL